MMVRKGAEVTEFVYGLGISVLEPPEHLEDEADMPLRFVSVQLQLPDSSKNFDIDVHAFLFESDGTYVDCVFYKNPTLAGKSVRLLQEQQELLVDLRYVPKRCSFIVCTLAIYSGGTVAQLGNGTVKLAALVPRLGLDEGVQFPHLPSGQIPSTSDFYEWVCLGILPLRARSSHGEECSMMLCLLAQHAGFWYFKPVLKPVTAFTPQGLIEPAQDFVTRHVARIGTYHEGVELGTLLSAVRDGTQLAFELTDTEGSVTQGAAGHEFLASDAESWVGSQEDSEGTGRQRPSDVGGYKQRDDRRRIGGDEEAGETWEEDVQQMHDGMIAQEDGEWGTPSGAEGSAGGVSTAPYAERRTSVSLGLQVPASYVGTRGARQAQMRATRIRTRKAGFGSEETDGLSREGQVGKAVVPRRGAAKDGENKKGGPGLAVGTYERGKKNHQADAGRGQLVKPSPNGSPMHEELPRGARRGVRRPPWRSADSGQRSEYTGAAGADSLFTSYPPDEGYQAGQPYSVSEDDGQKPGSSDDLRELFTSSWKDSVERRLAALEYSVDSIRTDIRSIAAATSEMQQNNKLYVQELREKFTELKGDVAADIESALAGPLESLSTRLEKVEANEAADAKQLAEQQQKLWAVDRMVVLAERNSHLIAQSLSERCAVIAPRSSQQVVVGEPPNEIMASARDILEDEEKGVFATKALAELTRMQHHAEAFGACLRQLASGTAPDGLKGLNPVERRVLSFAGTPKVFAALHELERAMDAINLHGSGAVGPRLY